MALLITFGNKGLVDNFLMNKQLAELKSQNVKIAMENTTLKKKILLLRDDLSYVEYIARNELGMGKEGDIVYRLVK